MKVSTWAALECLPATTCMPGKTFVDTNVLLYAHDLDAGAKHVRAKEILRNLWLERAGALSVQVLQEFYVNVTRKISQPLPKNSARQIVGSYAMWCGKTSADDVSVAFRIEDESQINFWDALIIASAISAGADTILSEDMNAGQRIAGIRIENPFASAT